jgi:Ca2+-binding RTX toxin-like protein
MAIFRGTKNDDFFDQSSDTASDTFNLFKGGNDTVLAGSGNDLFKMGAALNAGDQLDGGAGRDVVLLHGNYSAGLVLDALTLQNIEVLRVGDGFDYNLTMADGNVAAGTYMSIDAKALGATHSLTFDGGLESDGHYIVCGGAGNDSLTGGALADKFHLEKGGNDTVHGGDGNDVVLVGAKLTSADAIDGGAGSDTLSLAGATTVTLGASTIANIETIVFGAGFNYSLVTNNGNVAAGQTLTVDAGALGAGNGLTFNGSAEADGSFAFTGGAGVDFLRGGSQADTFDMTKGGNDQVIGNAGNDTFYFGSTFNSSDNIDGGNGTDTVNLAASGTMTVTFNDGAIAGIESFVLQNTGIYNLSYALNDFSTAVTVDGSALTAGHTLTFTGTATLGATFAMTGGADNDVLTGGKNNDSFNLTQGGNDTASGGTGNDTFSFGAAFTAADTVNGGNNSDTISLNGDYSAGVTFDAATMTNVEVLVLQGGHSYSLATNNANVASGQTLNVVASSLTASDSLIFNGSAETNGKFNITGGAGADMLTGGSSADIFTYTSAAQSTSTTYDTITNFAAGMDRFDLAATVTQVYSASGALDSGASFDSQLAGLNAMHVGGATEITVTGGTLDGHIFLIVDGDGNATYDAGSDYVIDITGHTGTIAAADFI